MSKDKLRIFVEILAGFKKDGEAAFDIDADEDPKALIEWVIDEARSLLRKSGREESK